MNNYSVTCLILGYRFNIVTHDRRLLEKQVKHIQKFCISELLYGKELDLGTTIEYIEDEKTFKEMKKIFSEENEIVQSFEGIYHQKAYGQEGTEYFMQIPEVWILKKVSDNYYIIVGDGKKSTIKYPFRVIREIIVRMQENNGKFFMHATALNIQGKGIVILGNSGSGKTTFFTKLTDSTPSVVLSNDRVFFYSQDGTYYMDYFPIPVVHKYGTVSNSKYLSKYIIEDNNYNYTEGFAKGEESIIIPLTDLAKMFPDLKYAETSKIDIAIFSKINFKDKEKFEVRNLTTEEAIKRLSEVCFTPIDSESIRKEWVYMRKKSIDDLQNDANHFICDFVKKVRCIYLEYGCDVQNAYELLKKYL